MKRHATDYERIFTKYTLKDWYPEYIKNFQNLILRQQRTQFRKQKNKMKKNRQNIWADTLPKKI
jgi:hypothetical protein